ncbi:hypothetical protein Scep_024094 [Stephania cephalantha]|uniref:Uncharacterized protein n=1 Tax=Stephania cephalantha TaxID=152367 RepID=A0AAP0HY28_9MAGN
MNLASCKNARKNKKLSYSNNKWVNKGAPLMTLHPFICFSIYAFLSSEEKPSANRIKSRGIMGTLVRDLSEE